MKKLRFTNVCKDKYTKERYAKGAIHEFEDARADEIVATGYAKVIEVIQENEENVQEPKEEIQEVEDLSDVDMTIDDVEFEDEPVKLSELTKEELVALAKEHGVSTRGNKADIINRLLEVQG